MMLPPIVSLVLALASTQTASRTSIQHADTSSTIAVHIVVSHERIHAGSVYCTLLFVTIADGWHVNAPVPTDETLVGTTVRIPNTVGIDTSTVRYPEPVERQPDFIDVPIQVYEGTIAIRVEFRLATDLLPGAYEIPALITYQACTGTVCREPATIEIAIPLHVVPADTQEFRVNQTLFEPSEKEE